MDDYREGRTGQKTTEKAILRWGITRRVIPGMSHKRKVRTVSRNKRMQGWHRE